MCQLSCDIFIVPFQLQFVLLLHVVFLLFSCFRHFRRLPSCMGRHPYFKPFTRVDSMCDFLSSSLDNIALPMGSTLNPIALRMAKTLWSFGHSECNRVKGNMCSPNSKFFQDLIHIWKLGNIISRVTFPNSLPIHEPISHFVKLLIRLF